MKEYTLKNDCISFSILNVGASISSIKYYNGQEYIETTLRYEDEELYLNENPFYLNCVVGPHAGRIKNGQYSIGDSIVNLEKGSSGNHLHGGSTGFHKLVFEVEEFKNKLVFTSFDKVNSVNIEINYTLEGSNLIIDMHAIPQHDQVINMTQHTYFNLSDEPTIHNHLLRVDARCVAALDETGVPMSKWLDVAGTPFDFFAKRALKEGINNFHSQFSISNNIDHPFKTNNGKVVLESHQTKVGVEIKSDAEYTVIYASNYFNEDIILKGRGHSQKHGALAIEPQDLPNDVNIRSSRSQIYGPDKPFSRKIVYNFYTLI